MTNDDLLMAMVVILFVNLFFNTFFYWALWQNHKVMNKNILESQRMINVSYRKTERRIKENDSH